MPLYRLAVVCGVLAACTGVETAQPRSADQVPRTEPAKAPDPTVEAASGCDEAAKRACFGPMLRIAGTALIEGKGVDGWRRSFETGPAVDAELSRPHFVMADRPGNLYVADKDAHAVRQIKADGSIHTLLGAPELKSPNGLWAGDNGVIYVLDLGHAAIKRRDTDGKVATLFEVPGGISIGRGLWVSDDETLAYVASNTKVLRWTPTAGVETLASGFASLGNLVVDSGGHLVVTDRGAGRVFRVGHDGKKNAIAGSGEPSGGGDGRAALNTALPGVRAIWFDRGGGYFLGTHESDAVWYVDGGGTIHRFLGSEEVNEVRGLSEDAGGNLWIVDHDGGRVWRLDRLR